MKALELATGLRSKRSEIREWKIFVADVADLDNPDGCIAAYRIETLELDEAGGEIRFIIEYPDRPDSAAIAMTVAEFLDRLLPLASDNPDFEVEASIKVELVMGGMRWDRYGMPLREVMGWGVPQILILGVEGLADFPKWVPEGGG